MGIFIFNDIKRQNWRAIFRDFDEIANFDSIGTGFDFFILSDNFEVGICASKVGDGKMVEFAVERELKFAKSLIEELTIYCGKNEIEISIEPLVVIDENSDGAGDRNDSDSDEKNLEGLALFVIEMFGEKLEQAEEAGDINSKAAAAEDEKTSRITVNFNRDTVGQEHRKQIKKSKRDEREFFPEFEFWHFPPLAND